MFDAADPSPQYELAWSRDLFVAEATVLLEDSSNPSWLEDAELLLEEAFAGSAPKDDLRKAKWHDLPPELFEYPAGAGAAEVARAFLAHIVSSADKLPARSERRPYWAARRAVQPTTLRRLREALSAGPLQQDWVRLVENLQKRGYLDDVAPQGCAAKPAPSSAAEVLAAELTRSLHVDILWPLHHEGWDSDTFYGLVEVVHDLVARPRHRDRHNLPDCGWHYSKFARTPGQMLYRSDVDQLLARHGEDLRFSSAGEDKGRLVHPAGDDRDELVHRVLDGAADTRDERAHAVALFRARTAGVPEKRSAIVTLAGLLEQRRKGVLEVELTKGDSGALFDIANNFDLRHRRADQRTDYDPAFLDWIFWWYLATIELTDRLLTRRDAAT